MQGSQVRRRYELSIGRIIQWNGSNGAARWARTIDRLVYPAVPSARVYQVYGEVQLAVVSELCDIVVEEEVAIVSVVVVATEPPVAVGLISVVAVSVVTAFPVTTAVFIEAASVSVVTVLPVSVVAGSVISPVTAVVPVAVFVPVVVLVVAVVAVLTAGSMVVSVALSAVTVGPTEVVSCANVPNIVLVSATHCDWLAEPTICVATVFTCPASFKGL